MKTILGTGQLGMAIMHTLLQDNPFEEIILVNRSGKISGQLPANVSVIAADVSDQHELDCIIRDATIVYSCTDVPYENWYTFYPAAAQALAYALRKSDAKLVFADNMYSYGNLHGAQMAETLPHTAKTQKGILRANVLKTLLLHDEPFSERVAIVKAADFIGPHIHKGIFGTDFMERLYADKPVRMFGKLQLPHTFTYIKDFARAIVNVSNAPDAFKQVWHTPNADAVSIYTWISLFEQHSGHRVLLRKIPKAFVRIATFFNTMARELYELAYQFEHPYLVGSQKYIARFGNHATPHATIVADTISWFESRT